MDGYLCHDCFLLNWALFGSEAAAVECECQFSCDPNHLILGKVSVVIARNIGQAPKEMVKDALFKQ